LNRVKFLPLALQEMEDRAVRFGFQGAIFTKHAFSRGQSANGLLVALAVLDGVSHGCDTQEGALTVFVDHLSIKTGEDSVGAVDRA
jgi:hypothetical protein